SCAFNKALDRALAAVHDPWTRMRTKTMALVRRKNYDAVSTKPWCRARVSIPDGRGKRLCVGVRVNPTAAARHRAPVKGPQEGDVTVAAHHRRLSRFAPHGRSSAPATGAGASPSRNGGGPQAR